MSFDPMAAALDWLDAYRDGDIETILKLYAKDADICCGCGGMKTITGLKGGRGYWVRRLAEYPASRLANIQPAGEGALISYVVRKGVVSAVFRFNSAGQISSHECGPSN
ncbi:hypothetical protein ABH994_003254 [Bradyrhizobium yuanmingense]|uniref:nuclear transport factor 2 family protein n=1 Tax=Bradyrhizobium yuanmingense TaxID=108015 RepID=UPI003512E97E